MNWKNMGWRSVGADPMGGGAPDTQALADAWVMLLGGSTAFSLALSRGVGLKAQVTCMTLCFLVLLILDMDVPNGTAGAALVALLVGLPVGLLDMLRGRLKKKQKTK
eukprot:gnl/TRDRNA2_/TRDRNA2_158160_c0_seq2.p2 gnl/TRDRNA2_/TRDRNA2_158160_c0~~gnl/TRDRNA2_/TRDRNA2_158160_c0_seq2.p2  ORF type:complete len:107 (-),score=20.25 gnl/TRDRNA2_/TRDRNA2_158160_c0_seq2:70-390(-)